MVGSSRRNVRIRSFRNDKPSGPGRKFFTIFPVFMGSSVYVIFFLINLLPLSPVTCSNDPDYAFSIGKADRHDAAFYLAKAEKTIFIPAVIQVFDDNMLRIGKGVLGFIERNPVLFRVLCILEVIPFKVRWFYGAYVIRTDAIVNRKKGRRRGMGRIWRASLCKLTAYILMNDSPIRGAIIILLVRKRF